MERLRSHADVLGVFVKAPSPGRVKTRLASAIGAEAAARVYRDMGRAVVRECASPDRYRTAVWFTPATQEASVSAWLDACGHDDVISQPEGGLGSRLAAVFGRHFADGARRVVVVGSDCPGVSSNVVSAAFAALERTSLVVGPALDGGFYLLGLAAPAPALFDGVAWSTDAVCSQVLLNASRLGLSTSRLGALRDVDTVADARMLGLLPPARSRTRR